MVAEDADISFCGTFARHPIQGGSPLIDLGDRGKDFDAYA